MIPLNLVPYLVEVDENMIEQAANLMGGENTFKKLLFYGEIYRKAGLKPLYMTTEDMNNFVVTCTDTYNKKLN